MGYFLWVINMNKEYITIVSTKVGIDCNRPDLVGKSIVIYDNDKKHCYKTFFILSDEKYELKRNRMAYNKYVIHE